MRVGLKIQEKVGEKTPIPGSAQRRIESMRLLKELPEMEERIQSGSLNLSLSSQIEELG